LGEGMAIGDESRDFAFRIELQIFRGMHVVPVERHRPALEGNADLVQRDVHRHRTRTWGEVEREHVLVPVIARSAATKQSSAAREEWIASSLALLAMTSVI